MKKCPICKTSKNVVKVCYLKRPNNSTLCEGDKVGKSEKFVELAYYECAESHGGCGYKTKEKFERIVKLY